MKCVPFPRNLFHAPCARARREPGSRASAVKHMWIDEGFYWFSKLKRQLRSSGELEASRGDKSFPGFFERHLRRLSPRRYVAVC